MPHQQNFKKVPAKPSFSGKNYPYTVLVPLENLEEIGGKQLGDEIFIRAKTRIVTLSPNSAELGIMEVALESDPVQVMGHEKDHMEKPEEKSKKGFLMIMMKKGMK